MKAGYLIPEFPGQTHAFFMRERAELENRGVDSALYSTRPPANGAAAHEWAAAAAAETTYLTPIPPGNCGRRGANYCAADLSAGCDVCCLLWPQKNCRLTNASGFWRWCLSPLTLAGTA
jgi:hypothetical protein